MRRALFLHTQKTAGTSIQQIARDLYGAVNVTSHAGYEELGVSGCQRIDFVSGHFGYEFAEPLMSGRYSFTFLRDPIERILSLYSFSAGRPAGESPFYDVAREEGLEAFLRLAHRPEPIYREMFWNHQTWQLAYGRGAEFAGKSARVLDEFDGADMLAMAKRHLSRFNFVGLVEQFDEDAATIFRALGAERVQMTRANASANRPGPDSLPLSTMDLLHEMTDLDMELYRYAQALRRPGLKGKLRRLFN
ncbi:sulfotransferase family 2 domain-containing protein [Aminobacter sp. Piv2-1]|uniref:sulfotransferase family 2 domain-containing protein n=1 Tax=Aminobacter sp. Piv2-1 TaxID=3031122 RepID=UPI00309690D5